MPNSILTARDSQLTDFPKSEGGRKEGGGRGEGKKKRRGEREVCDALVRFYRLRCKKLNDLNKC